MPFWTLEKMGLEGTPSKEDWLMNILKPGSRVGVDPFHISANEFKHLGSKLEAANIRLVATEENLVDKVWDQNQPKAPLNPVLPLNLEFTGQSWQDKVKMKCTIRTRKTDTKPVFTWGS